MKRALLILLPFAALGIASWAGAHGNMVRAIPAPGSAVHGSPKEVTLSFSQTLEREFSTARVLDANGNTVAVTEKQYATRDGRLLRVLLPPLAPGSYRVVWRALSEDGHITNGDFTFNVEP
jgi:methionine-rich copper-binding protein CopC